MGVRSSKEAEVKSIKAMAKEWGKVVKKKAVAERSAAVTIFKKIWFDNESPFVLVTNVLETNLRKTDGDMEINPAITATGIKTVEEVRQLTKSDDMYLNPALYSLICGGVESGKFKQNPRREPATISDLLTVAHEALIRSELHFALEKSKNRHVGSIVHGELRKEEWKVFRDLVWNDRKKNEVNAHSHLISMMLGSSECIPVVDGKMVIGQWQSVLLVAVIAIDRYVPSKSQLH